jgi:prolyl-tRNA synthetase
MKQSAFEEVRSFAEVFNLFFSPFPVFFPENPDEQRAIGEKHTTAAGNIQ